MVAGLRSAELRSLWTVEGEPLVSVSVESDAFCVWLRAYIGEHGEKGEESFDFAVCSPSWLERELEKQGPLSGRFLLIVQAFEPAQIEQYVRRRVEEAKGGDWSAIAEKLSRWSAWEFEDYRS
ncbi:Imm8 family immunity protein [Sphingomonas sp. MMS12-HWE2-04]|uniref:Imm8 family immunity protein n=1 Tax=Sphingomonas sp. MMS12-HWE2-04 TaxID=3234199 RepID=UPI00384C13DB